MKYALLVFTVLAALGPLPVRAQDAVTCRAPVGQALEVIREAEMRDQAVTRRVGSSTEGPPPIPNARSNQGQRVTRPVSNDHIVSQVAVTRRVPPPLPKKPEPILELTDRDIITVVASPHHASRLTTVPGDPPSRATLSRAEVFDPRRNPYRATEEPTKSGASGQYRLNLPKRDQFKLADQPLSSATLPTELRPEPGTVADRLAAYLRRTGKDPQANSTPAGEGSSFVAHFVHPDAPVSGATRLAWAAQAADYVLKVLKLDALGDAYGVLKRYLLERELFEELSRRSRFGEDRLVRPVRLFSNAADHAAGILKVEAMRGPRLDQVQEAILVFRNPSRKSAMSYADARALLKDHFPNLEEDPAVSLANSVEEAQQRIDSLGKFYADTHNLAILTQKRNGLMRLANRMPDGSERPVGFDFGRGENVFWSSEERIWIATE